MSYRTDKDGYVLLNCNPISSYGASEGATPEENFAYIQAAINAGYRQVTFGKAGETYIISQPLYLKANQTFVIDAEIKIKDGSTANLTANYTANDEYVTVDSIIGFAAGEWIGITDNDQTVTYEKYYGYCTKIASIDIENSRIYLSTPATAYNYTTANSARIGHVQSVMVAEEISDFIVMGNGCLNGNYQNQSDINGLENGGLQELRAGCCLVFEKCDDAIYNDVEIKYAQLHGVMINGRIGGTYSHRITLNRPEVHHNHDKNINIRCTDTITINDPHCYNAIYEDGIIAYIFVTNLTINNPNCHNNPRAGLYWNSAQSNTCVINNAITADNGWGLFVSAKNLTVNGILLTRDAMKFANQYNACDNIIVNDSRIDGWAYIEDHNGAVEMLGEITNIYFNDLIIYGCDGYAFYSTNQFTPANPPVNVLINSGGIYDHTGEKASLADGTDITFTDFDNYP